MDKAVEQANETGRSDFIMRTEIEHLKQDLYGAKYSIKRKSRILINSIYSQRSEDRRQEVEILLETQSAQMEDLQRKVKKKKRTIKKC